MVYLEPSSMARLADDPQPVLQPRLSRIQLSPFVYLPDALTWGPSAICDP